MKSIKFNHFVLLWFFIGASSGIYSQVTTLSYQSIPSMPTANCFFNIPPGPNNPRVIGGYNHYGIVGGVDYTGNEFFLPTSSTGDGTGFGINYPFSQSYNYRIIVKAKASASTIKLLWAANQFRTAIPSSCAPGFPNIITQSANATSSITSISTTYTDYILIENYSPSAANVNYFLMSDYNTANAIGSTQIQSVTITKTCKPPTVTSATALGNRQIQVSYAHPNGNAGVGSHTLKCANYIMTYIGIFPVPVILAIYSFPVSLTGPATVTVPNTGLYWVSITSNCTSFLKSTSSNTISVNVN